MRGFQVCGPTLRFFLIPLGFILLRNLHARGQFAIMSFATNRKVVKNLFSFATNLKPKLEVKQWRVFFLRIQVCQRRHMHFPQNLLGKLRGIFCCGSG
jgi:hypothetical protein